MHSRLLISEHPIQVLPQLAAEIGLNEAIVLQQLHYWLDPTRTGGTIHEGRKWVYNTYNQWQVQFPFWSIDTIKRTIRKLEEIGVVDSTDTLNPNPRDRTKWYSINYHHEVLSDAKCTTLEEGKMPHSEEGKMHHSTLEHRLPTETTNINEQRDSQNANERFNIWYQAYPSKIGKKAAHASFMRHATNVPLDVLLAAVEQQKQSQRWQEGYIPNPSTWLNQGRWEDELPAPKQDKLPNNMRVNNDRDASDEEWLGSYFRKGAT